MDKGEDRMLQMSQVSKQAAWQRPSLDYYGKTPSDVRFQQDRATPHTSTPTKRWFSNNGFNLDEIMDWPPQSPDLNPIEHLWDHLDTQIRKKTLPSFPSKI